MTLCELIPLLHGKKSGDCYARGAPTDPGGGYTSAFGHVPGKVPCLHSSDGPQGYRAENGSGTSTAWPSTLTAAATWDEALLLEWGKAMGDEFYRKGSQVQLGPGCNVHRVPHNGRNFEYISGEDPFLGYRLVQPVVRGIQSKGVIANAKHYVNNNQETDVRPQLPLSLSGS